MISAVLRRRYLVPMIGLGYTAGLLQPLHHGTLVSWLHDEGLSTEMIGLFAWASLPVPLKLLWAPLLDRYRLPFLGGRRGWMLVVQLLLIPAVGGLGLLSPGSRPLLVFGAVVAMVVLAASHDIVVDAYRVELLEPDERGSGTSLYVAAYRIAMIVAGGGALWVADLFPWPVVFGLLSLHVLLGVATTLLSPEPRRAGPAPRTLESAVVEPLRELLARPAVVWLLVAIATYKLGDIVAGFLMNDFLQGLGFSKTAVGGLKQTLGVGATVVGVLAAGGLVDRWGLKRSLVVFGVLQATANVAYAALASVGPSATFLAVAVTVDHLFNGMGTAAFSALLLAACHPRYSASQFALFSGMMMGLGTLITGGSGYLEGLLDWPAFFLATALVGLLALTVFLNPRLLREEEAR